MIVEVKGPFKFEKQIAQQAFAGTLFCSKISIICTIVVPVLCGYQKQSRFYVEKVLHHGTFDGAVASSSVTLEYNEYRTQ